MKFAVIIEIFSSFKNLKSYEKGSLKEWLDETDYEEIMKD